MIVVTDEIEWSELNYMCGNTHGMRITNTSFPSRIFFHRYMPVSSRHLEDLGMSAEEAKAIYYRSLLISIAR